MWRGSESFAIVIAFTDAAAKSDVTVTNGYNEAGDDYGLKYKEKGLLSSKSTAIKSHDEEKKASPAIISGDTISILSGKDTRISGSQVIANHDVKVAAGGNATITSAEEREGHDFEKKVQKSGFLGGGGFGFTIGSEKRKDHYEEAGISQKGSLLGSTEGNVSLSSGNAMTIESSDLAAGKNMIVAGKNILVSGKDNIYTTKEDHEYKRSGLTVSLGGGLMQGIGSVYPPLKNAAESRDNALKGLYTADAAFNGTHVFKQYDTLSGRKRGLSMDIGISGMSYHVDVSSVHTEMEKSRIAAKNTVHMESREDMTFHGAMVTGKDIVLEAGKDIHLEAAENKYTMESHETSKAGGISTSWGIGGLQDVKIYGSAGKGIETEKAVSHDAGLISAENHLYTASGEDTVIRGSRMEGGKVTVESGGHLSIESLQDTDDYRERSSSSGFALDSAIVKRIRKPDGLDKPYLSTETEKGYMDSVYSSVTNQAGIYVGKEGYDITVKDKTQLKGAVISGEADKDKNRLSTGTLEWENVENKADYRAGGSGISFTVRLGGNVNNDKPTSEDNSRFSREPGTDYHNRGDKIVSTADGNRIPLNERGLLPVSVAPDKGKDSTVTKSAVSPGKIVITHPDEQKQDLKDLDRNTRNSLRALQQIFDKAKVEEKQKLVEEISIVGNEAIHEIAAQRGWKEGSPEKMVLHSILGAITDKNAGGNIISGMLAGGIHEYVIGCMEKNMPKGWLAKHPDIVQNVVTAVGTLVGSITGNQKSSGYISQMGTKWNEYYLEQRERTNEELLAEKNKERQEYPIGGRFSQQEIAEAEKEGRIKPPQYYSGLAVMYKGGAGIALDMSTLSDSEIQMKYGNQVELIEERTFIIKPKSDFAQTIIGSINYTNAVGDAIRRVKKSGVRDQYVNFTIDISSDSFSNKIFDNPSFLLGGTYSGNLSIMIDSDGVIHERCCIVDNYNFERHDLSDTYGLKEIMELNNDAALSMQAGYLHPFMWILYINKAITPYGERDE